MPKSNKIHTYNQNLSIVAFFAYLLLGCNTGSSGNTTVFTEHTVINAQLFLRIENAPFLGRPTAIKAVADGLFIVDEGHYQITKVDRGGNQVLSFGNHGRGPGEIQSIAGFWTFETEYLVYDYNSFKFLTFDHRGKLINEEVLNENPIDPDSGFSIPITLDALSSDKLLIPTSGRHGSLFAIADRNTGDVTFTGFAVGEFVKSYNNQEVMQALSRGEIPSRLVNLVMLSSSSTAIYSLQQTTGVLEKYTHTGKKVWEKKLNIPVQNNLFDQISEHNMGMGPGDIPRIFMYARAMDALDNGVALLLNLPEDQPLTIVWIPEDGNTIDLIEVEGITLDVHGFVEGFTVSPKGTHAYFLEQSSSKIFKFEWPI